jgi:L-threonylcarbamoyladenylate synthase
MISPQLLERAAALIRAGGLVAFPTETVYGLGANALDALAVARIFTAKGRPATSPLIVHVDSIAMARTLVHHWPDSAEKLASKFWPGPLSLVLEKDPQIPDEVTAGLGTVGLRLPAHPIARALIRAVGLPIAAPSANRFTGVSPTTAEHVRASLGEAVDLILDGGPTQVGIESTVLSLVAGEPLLLRPGMISQAMIEAVIGPIDVFDAVPVSAGTAHAAPGMHHKHYSPHTPVKLVSGGQLPSSGRGAYLWLSQTASAAKAIAMPNEPEAYAAAIYGVLHELDAGGFDWIAIESVPDAPQWAAIADRLRRASAS